MINPNMVEPDDIILEHLLHIRSVVEDTRKDVREILEGTSGLQNQYANISNRLDRVDLRIDRIEQRLDLTDA
jgi:predicted  nucleic acid-binding Zn-ribbon protein